MVIDFSRSALLEIDVQNDFCPAYTGLNGEARPEGALSVKNGDNVIQPLNLAAQKIAASGGLVAATQDWHPPSHISFASAHPGKNIYDIVSISLPAVRSRGGRKTDAGNIPVPAAVDQALWPDHCVRGSPGARLHDSLDRDPVRYILRKGTSEKLDSYSAFFENDRITSTGLEGLLKGLGINTVFLGGLAADYCVLYSALDCARLGFKTILLTDAVQGVGVPEGSIERAFGAMREARVDFISTRDLK